MGKREGGIEGMRGKKEGGRREEGRNAVRKGRSLTGRVALSPLRGETTMLRE